MRLLTVFLLLCAALIQGGCAQSTHDPKVSVSTNGESEYNHLDPEAILTGEPLPVPGVNQRPVVGTKKVLLVVGQWTGTTALDKDVLWAQSLSSEEKSSLRSYIRDVSGGKLTLEGKMITADFGAKPDICNTRDAVKGPAEAAARAQGLNPADYDYLFIAAPCEKGTGSADAPGRVLAIYGQPTSSHLWIRLFGNNLGVISGPTYSGCPLSGNVITAPDHCKIIFYRDYGNPVSGGLAVLYPTHHRWYAGWLSESQVTHIKTSGIYRLVLRNSYLIDRPTTGPNQPRQIALEVRQPSTPPFDSQFPDNFAVGVWVRYTNMGAYAQDTQLDATSETASTEDATLKAGRTLKDVAAGITVLVCAVEPLTGSYAAISVGLNGETPAACSSLKKPTVTTPTDQASIDSNTPYSGTGEPGSQMFLTLIDLETLFAPTFTVPVDKTGHWTIRGLGKPGRSYQLTLTQNFGGIIGQAHIKFRVKPDTSAANR
ncbi:transposase [Pseudomonas sp. CVAP|uniref:transposase n=1 Tax=Pseudomonas sp. CVAP\|nr:transposase [Pseudomonas sp. CVAP\